MRKQQIVKRVAGENAEFGPYCADCTGPVYLDRIESGPRIGIRRTYRHVSAKCHADPSLVLLDAHIRGETRPVRDHEEVPE